MNSAQKRAVKNYRLRLGARGLARFEVLGRIADRDLIRNLAQRLADDDAQAQQLRQTLSESVLVTSKRGSLLEALRRSPLVGVELDLKRMRELGRKVTL
jgi:hypothetical protein